MACVISFITTPLNVVSVDLGLHIQLEPVYFCSQFHKKTEMICNIN